jgi:hypothetical protein
MPRRVEPDERAKRILNGQFRALRAQIRQALKSRRLSRERKALDRGTLKQGAILRGVASLDTAVWAHGDPPVDTATLLADIARLTLAATAANLPVPADFQLPSETEPPDDLTLRDSRGRRSRDPEWAALLPSAVYHAWKVERVDGRRFRSGVRIEDVRKRLGKAGYHHLRVPTLRAKFGIVLRLRNSIEDQVEILGRAGAAKTQPKEIVTQLRLALESGESQPDYLREAALAIAARELGIGLQALKRGGSSRF